MKKFILISTAVLALTVAQGQTNVSGGIFSNTTWTVAGSPYTVTGNVVVMTSVILTIQPGVLVKFNNGTNMEVRGDLQAIGTVTDTIVFTSSSITPTKGIWNGISFWNNLTVDFIKISFATTALDNTYQKIININHSRISNNNTGLNSIGATSGNVGYIDNSLFDSNTTAVSYINHANYISNSSFINNGVGFGYVFNVLISNNTFTGHTTKAIDGFGANYIGNTFSNNNVGLRIKLFNSSWQIKNNIITNNQTGVQARGDATSTPNTNFYNNTICNNTVYNVENQANISLYMKNNCWCTNDSIAIGNSIYDAYDNLALGIVYFSPFPTAAPIATFIMSNDTICIGEQVDFTDQSTNSPGNWNWVFTGGTPSTSTIQNPSNIFYNTVGTYTISLISSNCYGADTTTQIITVNTCAGIAEFYNQNSISIFPNPFSLQTTLQTADRLQNASLTVYNSVGRTVKRIDNLSGQTVLFHRDNLPSGLYFVRLTEENKTIAVDKLVITDR